MIDFASVTPFEIVRRLAAGGSESPSVFLLICNARQMDSVKKDLAIEIRVQLGVDARVLLLSEIDLTRTIEVLSSEHQPSIIVVTNWPAGLFESFDKHVVWMAKVAPILILSTVQIATRILLVAPNLRSRLADIFRVTSDRGGGASI